ncbi:hypothetical protein Btru_065076 [Bulinus truncatus]|nr:hypothetical protein Btru_065076 [Bulinus truncatus]
MSCTSANRSEPQSSRAAFHCGSFDFQKILREIIWNTKLYGGDQSRDLETSLRSSARSHSPVCPTHHKMGTTCSSNAYDHRDWHNVTDASPTDKHSRRSRKYMTHINTDNGSDISLSINDVCTCGSSPDCLASNNKTCADKRSSLQGNGLSDTDTHNQVNSRLSSSLDSTGHIKLTRVLSPSRARATATCDVSPHRLLTRRTNSPSGRAFTFDSRSSEALRQRSNSWSYSKYGNRPNYPKPGAVSRASTLGSPGQQRFVSSQVNQTQSAGVVKPPAIEPTKKQPVELHEPNCPLHVKTCDDNKFLSFIQLDTADQCLSPVARRRSASESHTIRPRRRLPRTSEVNENSTEPEHVHVRWADEEVGSSLSTSVSVSSIRPRSYSYGATDSAPHRPILKKVAGL